MPFNRSPFAFISAMRSFDAVGRRGVRKHSRISDEKEVSHGYEEVEEEEDVEVISAQALVLALRVGLGDTAVGF